MFRERKFLEKNCGLTFIINFSKFDARVRAAGATVARSTPDRKVIRSNRVRLSDKMLKFFLFSRGIDLTHGLAKFLTGEEVYPSDIDKKNKCQVDKGMWHSR